MTAREGRRFAFTIGIAFVVVGGLAAWRGLSVLPIVFWSLGGIAIGAGVVIPSRLGLVFRAWMALGAAISRVTSPIIMGLIYFGVMTPIGVMMRMCGRNPLRHREREGGYWMSAASGTASDLDNQF